VIVKTIDISWVVSINQGGYCCLAICLIYLVGSLINTNQRRDERKKSKGLVKKEKHMERRTNT